MCMQHIVELIYLLFKTNGQKSTYPFKVKSRTKCCWNEFLFSCRKWACRIEPRLEWWVSMVWASSEPNTILRRVESTQNSPLCVRVGMVSLTVFFFTFFWLHVCLVCLLGWRLRHWQLYKAHSHRRTGHHLLHPAAPQGQGGGHPSGAVSGDCQGSQGGPAFLLAPPPFKSLKLFAFHICNSISLFWAVWHMTFLYSFPPMLSLTGAFQLCVPRSSQRVQ